mgnify:CR=1 FL=1
MQDEASGCNAPHGGDIMHAAAAPSSNVATPVDRRASTRHPVMNPGRVCGSAHLVCGCHDREEDAPPRSLAIGWLSEPRVEPGHT